MTEFSIGSTYNGFLLERKETIEEIRSTVHLFRHLVLGTPALAIKNDDENKTFCIAFQTVPTDSTGVAHILEHSVLMGSEKYPVRDVFGEINKGGLMTFLNAMTGSDATWYPFATRNLKEYFNIMDVYCDVTLHPLLLPTTFEQEGWHYHKEAPDQPLQYQGVVYNEMKGAFSDPIRSIFHHTFRGLMPESTYAHESGGDPRHIPDLSYEDFVEFHRRHYHPSNCFLFFYGNAPLEQELAYVEDNFLAAYDRAGQQVAIDPGREIHEPVFIEDTYGVQPGSDPAGKTFLAVGSAVGTVLDRRRNAAFQIIANILFNSDGSPLKKAILDRGLCKDFGGVFLANSSFRTLMMTYLIGSDPEKRQEFLDVYYGTLAQMADRGLDHDLVLSELNKYEFSMREEMNKAQRGLSLIGKALPALQHGADPFEALQVEELLAGIRKSALEERYFEDLIHRYLIDNRATVVVTLRPDPERIRRTMEKERERLDRYEKGLDAQGVEELIRHTRELLALQHQPNDETVLRLLPRLELTDLSPEVPFHRAREKHLADRRLIYSDLDTNSIVYFDLGFDCSCLGEEHLPFLDLFATIVTEIGTRDLGYMEFAKQLNICTGGFNHSFSTYMPMEEPTALTPMLWFHVKALAAFLDQATGLISDVFLSPRLEDRQQIRKIVQREFAWAEHSVQSEGYGLASTRVFSHLGRAGQYNEYVSGVTWYLALKELAHDYDAREEQFLATLEQMRTRLFNRARITLSVACNPGERERFERLMQGLVDGLVAGPGGSVDPAFAKTPRNQAFCTSAEVVYNIQGCNLFPDSSLYNGHFETLKTWLSRDYLWNTVRQVGGAYGCFIQFNHITGNFAVISYRDPQVAKTFEAYDAIEERIRSMELADPVLRQLIVGTYGKFTPHQGPPGRAATARNELLSGITPEFKQARIREILDTKSEHLVDFAKYFRRLRDEGYRASIGNSARIREDRDLFDNIMEL